MGYLYFYLDVNFVLNEIYKSRTLLVKFMYNSEKGLRLVLCDFQFIICSMLRNDKE